MKHRIRKLFSLTLALSMLLSMIPLGISAELVDEFAEYETLEAIPFEFELDPGDLPFEQLKDAVLAVEDIPYCISPALAEERGHVNRLYLQEPDDYTVMFQNRDGSKTIYVFSYPVKSTGMSMNTAVAIQVNGSAISFSSGNIITSRIGVDLFDYNIGYCEIQTFYGGMLTADGVNITEDARGWARGGSSASNLVYNMSGSAAAEYNMNIVATANATLVPGITITPNDPLPGGGITVMAISYSTLAGIMSFKNVSTNQYLTLTTSTSPSLTTSSSIVNPYSRWVVQYDSDWGYIVSNFSNIHNTYLGKISSQSTLSIGAKSTINYLLGVNIISSANSTVSIGDNAQEITSNGSLMTKSWSLSNTPASCQWTVTSYQPGTFVSEIYPRATTRIEQSGVGFYLDYTLNPTDASYHIISLYYSDTNLEVTNVEDVDQAMYYINTPGVYSVYYKDSVTGVTSENFTLIITGEVTSIKDNYTYTIQPKNASGQFLTMELYYEIDDEGNKVYNDNAATNNINVSSISLTDNYEKWDTISRTFVFERTQTTGYIISATMPTKQYIYGPDQINSNKYNGTSYELTTLEDQNNALNYSNNVVSTKDHTANNSRFSLHPVTVTTNGVSETYYMIICGYSGSGVKVLSYTTTGVAVSTFVSISDAVLWKITEVGRDTRLIRQNSTMSCGVATSLTYTWAIQGSLDNLEGTSFLDKYSCLWDNMNTTSSGGVPYSSLYNHLAALNNRSYISYWDPSYRTTVFQTEFDEIGLVMVCAQMNNLPYYPSNKGGDHFFNVIAELSGENGTKYVLITDCHYNDEFHGIYLLEKNYFLSCIRFFIADIRHYS